MSLGLATGACRSISANVCETSCFAPAASVNDPLMVNSPDVIVSSTPLKSHSMSAVFSDPFFSW